MKKNNLYKCIICKNKYLNKNKFYPFCSKKCSDKDLSKWLNEEYSFMNDIIDHEEN